MTRVNIGLIGYGHWGPNHLRTFQDRQDSAVTWVAEPSPTRQQAVAARYPQLRVTAEVSELLACPDVQAVVVATPVRTHFELVRAALEAGKDVLCEKPLTLTSAESAELVALADRMGRILMVGHVFLFNPGIVFLRDQIERGSFGKLYYFDAVRTNLGPFRQDVGCIYDLASHDISVFNHLLGTTPVAVSARGQQFLKSPGHEDVAFISLTYPDQVLCHVLVSWLNPRKVRAMTVVGELQMASWDDMSPMEMIRLYEKRVTEEPRYNNFGEFQLVVRDANITIPKIPMFEPLARQAEHFLDCVRQRRTPLADGRGGLAVVRVLEAALVSAANHGQPVDLTSP